MGDDDNATTRGSEITTRQPIEIWGDIDRLVNDFRYAFDEVFWPRGSAGPRSVGRRFTNPTPPMDVEDRGNDYLVTMNVPGVKKKDISVQATPTSLQVETTLQRDRGTGKDYHLRERPLANYSRGFDFKEEIDPKKVEARVEDGVLEITLPKVESRSLRKITINVK